MRARSAQEHKKNIGTDDAVPKRDKPGSPGVLELFSFGMEVVESVQAGSTKRMIARRKIDCLVPDWQGVQQQEGRSGVLIKQSKE